MLFTSDTHMSLFAHTWCRYRPQLLGVPLELFNRVAARSRLNGVDLVSGIAGYPAATSASLAWDNIRPAK